MAGPLRRARHDSLDRTTERRGRDGGVAFIDNEYWSEVGETGWNLVKSQGRMHCWIEVEIFETEPTLTYDDLAHSRIADAVDGEVVESDPAYEVNGLRGFTVTRRDDLQRDPESNSAGVGGAVVASVRRTVLYEGRLQIVIVSTWPENSLDLREAVDAVERSLGLTGARGTRATALMDQS